MLRRVQGFPAHDCGPLRPGTRLIAVLALTQQQDRVLLVHAPSIWKYVLGQDATASASYAAIEKRYNRRPDGFVPKYAVPAVDLDKDGVETFRAMDGATSQTVKVRLTDARGVYLFLLRQLSRDAAGNAAAFERNKRWASGISGHAECAVWIGQNPFASNQGLDRRLWEELADSENPVVGPTPLNVPVIVPSPDSGRAVQRRCPGNDPQPAREPGVNQTPAPVPAPSAGETPSEAPYGGEYSPPPDGPAAEPSERLQRATDAQMTVPMRDRRQKTPKAPVQLRGVVYAWPGALLTEKPSPELRSAGGVDIKKVVEQVSLSPLLKPPDLRWSARPKQGLRWRLTPIVEMQLELLTAFARVPESTEDLLGHQSSMPVNAPDRISQDSSAVPCDRSAWNCVDFALSHPVIAGCIGGPPRFEHLARPGVFELVLDCLVTAGTTIGGAAQASAVRKASRGWLWILTYLWNRVSVHLQSTQSASSEGQGQGHLLSRLQALVDRARDVCSRSNAQAKKRARNRANNKDRRRVLGGDDGTSVGKSERIAIETEERRRRLIERCPELVGTLLDDMWRVVDRVSELRRTHGTPTARDALDLQNAIIRWTALSFCAPHIRPSIVSDMAVYLDREAVPECSRKQCHRSDCKGTIMIVSAAKDIAVIQAPHHKAAKGTGKRRGKAMTIKVTHALSCAMFREWVMWGHELLYSHHLSPRFFQHPLDVPKGTVAPRRPLLMVIKTSKPARQLRPTEVTEKLRKATGENWTHADARPAFVTILRRLPLAPGRRDDLIKQLTEVNGGKLPDFVDASAAACMGNSTAMWDNHYDVGEVPADAQTTDIVIAAKRRELLAMEMASIEFTAEYSVGAAEDLWNEYGPDTEAPYTWPPLPNGTAGERPSDERQYGRTADSMPASDDEYADIFGDSNRTTATGVSDTDASSDTNSYDDDDDDLSECAPDGEEEEDSDDGEEHPAGTRRRRRTEGTMEEWERD